MKIAILSTGTELLKGNVLNTNSAFLGQILTAAGLPPLLQLSVGDHPAEITGALAFSLKNADTVILSGGLGPTSDDLTLDAAARFFGLTPEPDETLQAHVVAFWAARHAGRCPQTVLRQARTIPGGEILPNLTGSAAGVLFHPFYNGMVRHIALLPGPPRELEPMVRDHLLPKLLALCPGRLFTGGFLALGGEMSVFPAVEKAVAGIPVEAACAATAFGTKIFLSGADRLLVDAAVETARKVLPCRTLPAGEWDLPAFLVRTLSERHWSCSCAESCTGGLVADHFVSVPGASAVFQGGVVSYANRAKEDLLHVPHSLLQSVGAVSQECALAMVSGCRQALSSDCAVSTTGIAGPGGGSAEKPVGLVYIAAAVPGAEAVRECHFSGDRRTIRHRAAAAAFQLLWELLDPEEARC